MSKFRKLIISPAILISPLVVLSPAIAKEIPRSVGEAIALNKEVPESTESVSRVKTLQSQVSALAAPDQVPASHNTSINQQQQPFASIAPPPKEQNANWFKPNSSASVSSKAIVAQVNSPVDRADVQPAESSSQPGIVDSNLERRIRRQKKAQVPSVSQLSDVQPSDWAYQALQSIVERYGCIAGYPDGTFRGNRAMTRYEFAAGLNACLKQVEKLIAANAADLATRQDLETLRRLTDEFSRELTALGTRLDKLETRTAYLEQHQFSITTKLTGEALISLRSDFTGTSDRPGNSGAVPGLVSKPLTQGGEGPAGRNTTLGYRARINFTTSFTGKDQLLARLEASNIIRQGVSTFTNMGALQPDDATGDQNTVFYGAFPGPPLSFGDTGTGRISNGTIRLDTAQYAFPLTSQANVRIIATGGKLDDFAPTLNALDYGGAGLGSITEFGQRNVIYRLSGAGGGAGIDYKFNQALRLSLGYLGGNRVTSATPSGEGGLFNGTFGAIAQLTVSPTRNLDLGLTYVRTYFTTQDVGNQRPGVDGGVGSHHAAVSLGAGPTEINSYGIEASYRFSPRFILGAWGGLSEARVPKGGKNPLGQTLAQPGGTSTIINWALTFAFPDLFKQGSLGGLVFGQPPKVTRTNGRFPSFFGSGPTQDYQGTSFHIEAFYRYPINSNISITPGVVVITHPEYNNANPALILGTLRTTFTF